jgi:UDP-N-acetylmuramoylalanine--D-glutamate ligase
MTIRGKKVTVVGLGKSGFAAARFLAERGATVRVTEGFEKKEALENASYLRGMGIEVETGRHTEGFIAGSDFVVTSPGVPKDSVPLKAAARTKIPVISEIELAFHACKGKIVAVTGSNGKTTTCNLIHRIFADAGRKTVLCGNVGYSFLSAVPGIDSKTVVVLELSSFQLEDSPRLRPKVSVILNLSANHLDRHKTMENYSNAKKMIFRNQRAGDTLILNHDDPTTRAMAVDAKCKVVFFSRSPLEKGLFYRGGKIWLADGRGEKILLDVSKMKLPGQHNLENALAAVAAILALKAPMASAEKTLARFRTLEHRIEPLGEIAGVRFINDSKSTTLASTRAAILATPKPLILIAGGRDKGSPFADIETLVAERVKTAVLYGESRDKIAAAWKTFRRVESEQDFRRAVRLAFERAERGDTILLSPMCTSFDQFSSYEHRGETFKKAFQELKSGRSAT